MFDRFDQNSRRLVVIAHEQAKELRHAAMDTGHLLLAMLIEDTPWCARLEASDLSFSAVQNRVQRLGSKAKRPLPEFLPRSHQAEEALGQAVAYADQFGCAAVSPDHLLLALTHYAMDGTLSKKDRAFWRSCGGDAVVILNDLGIDHYRLRNEAETAIRSRRTDDAGPV